MSGVLDADAAEERTAVRLPPDRLARARAIGRSFAAEHGLEARLAPYAAHRWQPAEVVPTLHLDDVSAIPFLVDIDGVEEYQHRARLRAGDGDLLAAVTPLSEGYEEYCRTTLGLGRATFVAAPPADGGMLAVSRACGAEPALSRLAAEAARRGGLAIHPYMGIEAVWELAKRIAATSGTKVRVLGPPPPVTWIANDKALFEDLVSAVLGRSWLVESRRESTVPALVASLFELAGAHERVALKRLRCASAMGNLVLDGAELRGAGRDATESLVESFLTRTEWRGDEAVLVVAWEAAALSPSTQLWIPPAEEGPPRLDGVYEQILEGATKVFVGSRPARFAEPLRLAIGSAALEVGAALQAMGYVGRCSFDHLVVGDPRSEPALRFTECNGRWGGTSTPMSLADRIFPGHRPPYRAQDFVHPALVGVSLSEVLARVGDELFDVRTGRGRYLFYNVGPLRRFGKLDVVALGSTQDEAEAAIEEDLPARLGCG